MADALYSLIHELFAPANQLAHSLNEIEDELEAGHRFWGEFREMWFAVSRALNKTNVDDFPEGDLRTALKDIFKLDHGARTQCISFPDVGIYLYRRRFFLGSASRKGWLAAKQGGVIPDDLVPADDVISASPVQPPPKSDDQGTQAPLRHIARSTRALLEHSKLRLEGIFRRRQSPSNSPVCELPALLIEYAGSLDEFLDSACFTYGLGMGALLAHPDFALPDGLYPRQKWKVLTQNVGDRLKAKPDLARPGWMVLTTPEFFRSRDGQECIEEAVAAGKLLGEWSTEFGVSAETLAIAAPASRWFHAVFDLALQKDSGFNLNAPRSLALSPKSLAQVLAGSSDHDLIPQEEKAFKHTLITDIVRGSITALELLYNASLEAATAQDDVVERAVVTKELGSNGGGTPPKKAPKRRGRKRADQSQIQRDEKIAADWQRAKEGGAYKPDFARDHGMSPAALDTILNRHRKRKNRADKKAG